MEGVVHRYLGHDLAREINKSLGSSSISTAVNMTWNIVSSAPTVIGTEVCDRRHQRRAMFLLEDKKLFWLVDFCLGGLGLVLFGFVCLWFLGGVGDGMVSISLSFDPAFLSTKYISD